MDAAERPKVCSGQTNVKTMQQPDYSQINRVVPPRRRVTWQPTSKLVALSRFEHSRHTPQSVRFGGKPRETSVVSHRVVLSG